MITGLKPRGFVWVIANRLAVSDRIGGSGFQHRRVRREEEINWLVNEAGITTVVNLLVGHPNQHSYASAGLTTLECAIEGKPTSTDIDRIYAVLDSALSEKGARVLVHRETVDDVVAGLMGGYLIHKGLLDDPIVAVAVVQEIVGEPIGPDGRAIISRQ